MDITKVMQPKICSCEKAWPGSMHPVRLIGDTFACAYCGKDLGFLIKDKPKLEPHYNRVEEWEKFSDQVRKHIVEYTLVQYGNEEGQEQVDSFTVHDCWINFERYYNRRKSATRGNKEKLRDIIKMAHYLSFIYSKLREELAEQDVY